MFIILAYDIETKRTAKIMKIVKKYLRPVQKSVFEGHISERNLKSLKMEISTAIDPEIDSVVIYRIEWAKAVVKECVGKYFEPVQPIL